ncbi:MAG: DUF6383 domain-containing protein [Prevotellaceae bacterium]|jgi:hypothetical protein|nr:DUF6383 domain-containing protein [Prevotellaceae bacterium]
MKTIFTFFTAFASNLTRGGAKCFKSLTKTPKSLKMLMLTAILLVGSANVWGETVTYTIASTSSVNTTGTAPDDDSPAAYSKSAGTMNMITNGQTATLTLSGYAGYKITNIVLSMRSAASNGGGTLSVVAGTTTIASVSDALFNTPSWYGAWSTSYVNVTKTPTSYDIQEDEDVVITITATANALYIQSYTITYEAVGDDEDDCEPHGMSFLESIVYKKVGDTYDALEENPLYYNGHGTENWESSNAEVASVDYDGNVTIKEIAGTTTITANPSFSAIRCSEEQDPLPSYTLVVIEDCTSVTLDASDLTNVAIVNNETATATINVKGENLAGDITVDYSNDINGIFINQITTITKEQAEDENGYDLELYIHPTEEGNFTVNLGFTYPKPESCSGSGGLSLLISGGNVTITGIDEVSISRLIYAVNNEVVFTAAAGETVTIYNALGQQLTSVIASDGENRITLPYTGVAIVRIGASAAKVVLK